MKIDNMNKVLMDGFSERGNNAFSSEDGFANVIFKKVGVNHYLQIEFNGNNYPAYNCGIVEMTDNDLIHHIKDNLVGWICHKCQFNEIKITNNRVDSDEELECVYDEFPE